MTKRAGAKRAYSDERTLEICTAIEVWFKSQEISMVKAGDIVNASVDTLRKWLSATNTPSAYFMERFHKLTGEPVFLLLDSERTYFKSKGQFNEDGTAKLIAKKRSTLKGPGKKQNRSSKPTQKKAKPRLRKYYGTLDKFPLSTFFNSVRKEEILDAIYRVYHALPKPIHKSSREYLGVSAQSIVKWLNPKINQFPNLGTLIFLYHKTAENTFLLTKSERRKITQRKLELPSDYPVKADDIPSVTDQSPKKPRPEIRRPRKEKRIPSVAIEPASNDPTMQRILSAGDLPTGEVAKAVEMTLRSAQTQIFGIEGLVAQLKKNNLQDPSMRKIAFEIIQMLTRQFDLQEGYSEEQPTIETDPKVIARTNKALGQTDKKEPKP
jgi:hypothetical protein